MNNKKDQSSDRKQRLKAAAAIAEFQQNLKKAEEQLDTDLQAIYDNAVGEAKKIQSKDAQSRLEKLKKKEK